MIYLSRNQLKKVQYLIEQSVQGNHILFPPEWVKKAATLGSSVNAMAWSPERSIASSMENSMFDESLAYEVEHHIERIMELPSLEQKQAYVESLPQEILLLVIRTYLNIVENELFERSEARH